MTPLACVVIGGGIAGLSAALRLRHALGAGTVVLLDAAGRLGGKIVTERRDDFVIEGGPDCFLASKPGGVNLCRELGIEERLVGTKPANRRSFVKRNGRLHSLPAGFSGVVPWRVLPLLTSGALSLRGRLRAGLEPFISRRNTGGDESVAHFIRRRFGREAYDHLMEPLLSGIYAGDGDALSLEATFPQLRALERDHGSLLGSMPSWRVVSGAPASATGFVTLPGGLVELVETLRTHLDGVTIRTGVTVRQLRRRESAFEVVLSSGGVLESRSVVLATPAHSASAIVEEIDEELAGLLRKIPQVSTAIVSLAFRRGDLGRLPTGYGYVSPRVEGGSVVACSITSNKFEGRAPGTALLLRCFLGRAGMDGIVSAPDDELLGIVRDELRSVLAIKAEPILSRVVRWPESLPQYTMGHKARRDGIFDHLRRFPGLQLAGASYHGVGIPDCIASGWNAAAAVTRHLGAA